MTIDEQIEIMQHFRDGGRVQVKHKKSSDWYPCLEPDWNFSALDYRKELEKKTRILTTEELIGKVILLKHQKGVHRHLITSCDAEAIYMPHMDSLWVEVKGLHIEGWTLENGSPLTVEVAE